MKLIAAAEQTRHRIIELRQYRQKIVEGRFRGSIPLTDHSIEINLLLMNRLFEIYKTSCRIKGKEIAQSFEVFSEQ